MFDSALWLPKDSAPVFIPGEAASGSGEVPAAAVPVLVSGAAASGSGDVPAPPVPREQRRRTGFRNPSWQVTGGHIVLDIGRDSLDAHCGNPAHDDEPGNPCRLNRKRRAHPSGRQLAQGRPLGEEFVWLELGAQMPCRKAHVDLLRPAGVNTPLSIESFSQENRLAARRRNRANPDLARLFTYERDQYTGEGEEPVEKP